MRTRPAVRPGAPRAARRTRRRSRWCRHRPRWSWRRRRCGPPGAGRPAGWAWASRSPLEVAQVLGGQRGARRSRPARGRPGGPGPNAPARSVSTPDRTDRSVEGLGLDGTGPTASGRATSSGVGQREGVVGRWGLGGVLLGRPYQVVDVHVTAPPGHAGGHPSLHLAHADDGDPPVPPAAVGGRGVVGEPDLDLAGLLDEHHAVVAAGRRGEGGLDHVLGRGQSGGGVAALIGRTPRGR